MAATRIATSVRNAMVAVDAPEITVRFAGAIDIT